MCFTAHSHFFQLGPKMQVIMDEVAAYGDPAVTEKIEAFRGTLNALGAVINTIPDVFQPQVHAAASSGVPVPVAVTMLPTPPSPPPASPALPESVALGPPEADLVVEQPTSFICLGTSILYIFFPVYRVLSYGYRPVR